MAQEIKQLFCLDLGMVRTGIARASMEAGIPEPLITMPTTTILNDLPKLIEKYQIDTIVIGLPRNLEGNDTKQTAWVRQWAETFKSHIAQQMYWQDEAATTTTAREQYDNTYASVDALSAAIILKDFLLTPADKRQQI